MSRLILGDAKDFCPNSPKRAREKTPTSETRALHVLLGAIFAHIFRVSSGLQRFSEGFQRFCPDFLQIKTFGGALAPPAPPPPTQVMQHKIGVLR